MQVRYGADENIVDLEISDSLKEEVINYFKNKKITSTDIKSFNYLRSAQVWPPIIVAQCSDRLELIDGRHRIFIAVEQDRKFIKANVKVK